jgi:hypothetical protein
MKFRPTIVLAGLVLVVSGCAVDDQATSPERASTSEAISSSETLATLVTTTTTSTSATSATSSVPEAYDWTAPLVGGGLINLAGYSNKAVVLWFWAPY